MRYEDKLTWINHELGEGKGLVQISEKFMAIIKNKLRGAIRQKKKCLDFFKLYSEEGATGGRGATCPHSYGWPSIASGIPMRHAGAANVPGGLASSASTVPPHLPTRVLSTSVAAARSFTRSTPTASLAGGVRRSPAGTQTRRLRWRSVSGLSARRSRTPTTSSLGRGAGAEGRVSGTLPPRRQGVVWTDVAQRELAS